MILHVIAQTMKQYSEAHVKSFTVNQLISFDLQAMCKWLLCKL